MGDFWVTKILNLNLRQEFSNFLDGKTSNMVNQKQKKNFYDFETCFLGFLIAESEVKRHIYFTRNDIQRVI